MLIIRFSRVGKRNHAQFRLVLAENSSSVKSKPIETLGSYDPHSKNTSLEEERIKYWVSKGVQLSDSAYNLMVSRGIIEGKKRPVKIKTKPAGETAEKTEEDKKTDEGGNNAEEKTEEIKAEENPAGETAEKTEEDKKTDEGGNNTEEKTEEIKAEENPVEETAEKAEEKEEKKEETTPVVEAPAEAKAQETAPEENKEEAPSQEKAEEIQDK